jgi:hypothetical protein
MSIQKIAEAYKSMVSEKRTVNNESVDSVDGEHLDEACGKKMRKEKKEKELDPVGKEDGDIDNDGDEDESDEYLAKRRKAIKKSIKDNPKTSDKEAEISKIGEKVTTKEDFDAMWTEFEEAVNQKKGATKPEKIDDKESPKSKEFIAKHTIDKKDHDDMEKIEEPKKREVKKEDVSEYEVIRRILSGQIED